MAQKDETKQKTAEENALQEMSVEELFARLEMQIADMEKGELSLEETFQKYEEGVRMLSVMNQKIDDVEKRLQILNEDGSREEES